MEQIKDSKEQSINITNRHSVHITGVSKVVSANSNLINLVVQKSKLVISGNELVVNKFDVDMGFIDIVGNIDSVKYLSKDNQLPLWKKIFK